MKSIKDNQVTVIFLSLLLMVSVFLLITEKEQFSQEIEDLKTHEKNLQGNIVKLQNTISKLESEKAVLESDNSQISDNLKQSNEIKKSYDYDVFLADLDNSDDTFEDLIDFFSLELGDGAIGQMYAMRVMDYYRTLEIEAFIITIRRLNNRSIDLFSYNIFEMISMEYAMSDDYTKIREKIKNQLLEALDADYIEDQDRQFIYSMLSHWYQ